MKLSLESAVTKQSTGPTDFDLAVSAFPANAVTHSFSLQQMVAFAKEAAAKERNRMTALCLEKVSVIDPANSFLRTNRLRTAEELAVLFSTLPM